MTAPVVTALVLDHASALEVSIASELFGVSHPQVLALTGRDDWYDFRLAGERAGQTLGVLGGAELVLHHGLEALATSDVVVLPMCPKRDDGDDGTALARVPEPTDGDVLDALRAAHERGATILSYCSGAFVLGEAGLLDGRRATTHWRFADAFRERFPAVTYVDDVLYVDDGAVLTSAGAAAGIDLTLHWLRTQHGAEVADVIARHMVVPPHRDGGQAQFAPPPPPLAETTTFDEVLAWALAHLDADVSVQALAARAAMSPRTFARHFRAATGTTPHRWVTDQRVARARQLLETTDLTVDRIATATGLGTATNLRARLHDAVGVPPTAYRRRFARG